MIIYDVEIRKAILGRTEEPLSGIDYCGGWRAFDAMGIAVIGAYDYRDQRYRVFCEDNFKDFQELVNDRSVIVGFNNLAFDNRLCEANGIDIPAARSYDLLVEIWKAAGLPPEYHHPSHSGFGLETVCEVNFGLRKSGNGGLAPVLWQQGKIGTVIDYCLQDVRLTRALLEHVVLMGPIIDPRDPGKLLQVSPPKLRYPVFAPGSGPR